MKNTRTVVALAASGQAATPGGANRQTFPPTMAAQERPPNELPSGRERKGQRPDRRGTTLWWSVFMFLMEGFAAYAASMHPTVAFSVEAALIAARRPHPWLSGRTPAAAEHERGPYLISETGNIVGRERVATRPVSQADGIG
jgi:hypothetical protein